MEQAFVPETRSVYFQTVMAVTKRKYRDPIAVEQGRRLKKQREARDMTQEALAKLIGYRQSAVGNWEAGVRRIRHEEAEKLAEVLGLPSAYFLGAISEQEARVIQTIRNGSD